MDGPYIPTTATVPSQIHDFLHWVVDMTVLTLMLVGAVRMSLNKTKKKSPL